MYKYYVTLQDQYINLMAYLIRMHFLDICEFFPCTYRTYTKFFMIGLQSFSKKVYEDTLLEQSLKQLCILFFTWEVPYVSLKICAIIFSIYISMLPS